jgi:D-glycero-D-manno-heptose 1,7-bisphosphate phosphatase
MFLDRDGVVIENRAAYVRSWADVAFIPRALDALARLAATPYAVVLITNQAAVGKGLVTLAEALAINRRVCEAIRRAGGRVDAAYLCPHRPEDDCACRKPKPGLLLLAKRELELSLADSWIIGDAATDLQAGAAAGVRGLLVRTGRGTEQAREHRLEAQAVADLAAALERVAQEREARTT